MRPAMRGRIRWVALVVGFHALAWAQGQPSDEDLSKAFAPEGPATAAPQAESPAAPAQLKDPLAEDRETFAKRVSETPADLTAWVKDLATLASRLGPTAQQQLFTTAARWAVEGHDDPGAARWARQWLLSCGPATDD